MDKEFENENVNAEEQQKFVEIDLNELSWWERFRMTKFGHFIEENPGPILTFLGGLSTLTAAVVGKRKYNTKIYTITEDTGEVFESPARKVKKVNKSFKKKKNAK